MGFGTLNLRITEREINQLQECGPERRWFDIAAAAEVLREPSVIFEGLKRDGFEHGLCYVGRPKLYGQSWESDIQRGMVFAVYVNCDHTVYEWRLEMEDADNPGYPVDWRTRFANRKWPN